MLGVGVVIRVVIRGNVGDRIGRNRRNRRLGGNHTTMPADMQASFQKVLDDARTQFGFPGVQAGVWMPDGTWVGTSGTAGQGLTTPITPADHARIGSITRPSPSPRCCNWPKGLVSLEDPISKYVPGMPNGDTATLGNLAAMTSGIPSYTENKAFTDALFANTSKAWTPSSSSMSSRVRAPMFAPGTKFYSNTNTVLLGMVMERVTGKPMEQIFSEQIFTPLGLTPDQLPGSSTEIPAPYLRGITVQGQPAGRTADATNWSPTWAFTAGEIISTLDDLRVWAKALATGQGLLGAEYQQSGWTRSSPPSRPTHPRRPTAWASVSPTVGSGTPANFPATTPPRTTTRRTRPPSS